MTLHELQEQVRRFAQERDWEQFHDPKNLSMALAGEAGELLEIFQWLTPAQSAAIMADPARADAVRHELADVLAYLLRLADVLEVDLATALRDKMDLNARRYPVDRSRGRSDKYDTYEN
ncbi:NTP pyrophosphatase, house-cleaning of non-canonical NTPs [Micromonospora phaseoli]|uniref:NTP pyrophosphatase, house-cleaning of non-canonical NTPs n=1 Tax=Micromonospora phaseoli TaxID=1144548 RepID=A0A1H7AWR3_9ACTN|nr:nucleotide pyrophosphohydrolase [Micromonospora phaseoli]PZV96304.1 NTP pyrophosphatase (non-canonical NTP hydrolase) [Micromonospora phaseoli]GIJ75984.1 nucleotide pyrophosphohydrolase [Micromonospora phaseoli]SEJ66320.1 NTP pyrophosphatase, house-cleaning of non-canonical NTPs [Micromonospora phaseoli]